MLVCRDLLDLKLKNLNDVLYKLNENIALIIKRHYYSLTLQI